MRKRVQHCISNAGVAFVWVKMTGVAPSPMSTTEHLVDLLHTIQSFPLNERGLIKLHEDPFAMNLVGRHPVWLATGQASHLRTLIGVARFLRCFDTSEA